MVNRLLGGLAVAVLISGAVFAADTEVILGDTIGATALSIKNSSSTEVLRITSSGEVKANGASATSGGITYYPQFRWDQATGALRATLFSTAVDTATPGLVSFAQGINAVASGTSSISLGSGNTASADSAIAIGKASTASAGNAVAIGRNNTASGSPSFAIGYGVNAGASSAVALGTNVSATGSNSIVLGSGTGDVTKLTNNRGSSVMIGCNSITPMLYVGQTKVGVNTWEATSFDLGGRLTITNNDGVTTLLQLDNIANDLGNRSRFAIWESATGANLDNVGAWNNASDRAQKKNIKDIKYGLADLMKLRPVSFNWKQNGKEDIGFIAQDVRKVIPEVVKGEEGKLTLSYGQLTALLAKAVQEQQKQINELKGEIAKLKAGK
ncbi:MAG: tail fiber domain-containing protein [Candidatus Margulisbacteria bacterium]|nr:tail fiber domain-containing protein [Candidatus Margulisiibacteriota bacterium]